MIQENNHKDSVCLRKYGDRLVMSGQGILLFGIWGTIRSVVSLYFKRQAFVDYTKEQIAVEDFSKEGIYVVYAVLIIVSIIAFCISLWFYLYIGSRAVRDGRGKKSSTLYLVFVLLIILNTFYLIFNPPDYAHMSAAERSLMEDTSIVTHIIDLTLCLACVDVIVSAVNYRRILNKIRSAEGSGEDA